MAVETKKPTAAQENVVSDLAPQKSVWDYQSTKMMAVFSTKPLDVRSVQAGTVLRHKAFGLGKVKSIGGIITVTFDGIDKRFQFPGSLAQGFLSIESVL